MLVMSLWLQGAEDDTSSLQSLSDDMREKLLQTLLERRLKRFTAEVCTVSPPLNPQMWHVPQ
jgi:hypothetical protein